MIPHALQSDDILEQIMHIANEVGIFRSRDWDKHGSIDVVHGRR